MYLLHLQILKCIILQRGQNLGENDRNTMRTRQQMSLSASIMLSLEGNALLGSNNVKVKSTWLNG